MKTGFRRALIKNEKLSPFGSIHESRTNEKEEKSFQVPKHKLDEFIHSCPTFFSSMKSDSAGSGNRDGNETLFISLLSHLSDSPIAPSRSCTRRAKSSRASPVPSPWLPAFHSAFPTFSFLSFFHWRKIGLFHFSLFTQSFFHTEFVAFCTQTLTQRHFHTKWFAKTATILPFRLIILSRDYHFFCPFSHTSPAFFTGKRFDGKLLFQKPFPLSRSLGKASSIYR